MATRNVHRYTIRAEVSGEIEFDQSKPDSYAAALVQVDQKREALKAAGARITHDVGKPVTVRGE